MNLITFPSVISAGRGLDMAATIMTETKLNEFIPPETDLLKRYVINNTIIELSVLIRC
jgi:hypothetical protein